MRLSNLLYRTPIANFVLALERWIFRARSSQEIVLAFAINQRFIRPLGTTLFSILRLHRGPVTAYILSSTPLNAAPLQKLGERFPNLNLHFLVVDPKQLNELPVSTELDHITNDTFLRFFLPTLLPNHSKVLYLDADIIACESLLPLWNTPIFEVFCAGVNDSYIDAINHKEALGFNAEERYINAGVLLLNLDKMRANQSTRQLIDLTATTTFRFLDQDAINLHFRSQLVELPEKYNVTSDSLRRKANPFRKHPALLHYTSPFKPWACRIAHQTWRYRALQKAWEACADLPPVTTVALLIGTASDEKLAHYTAIAKALTTSEHQVDLLYYSDHPRKKECIQRRDGILLWEHPANKARTKRWLKSQAYTHHLILEGSPGWQTIIPPHKATIIPSKQATDHDTLITTIEALLSSF